MISVLSCEEALSLDKTTIKSGYLSEKKLMDNAGRYIAQFITEYILDPFNQQFVVLAGPGNNGLDGIICHHYLLEYGVNTELLLINEEIATSWVFKEYSINDDSVSIYTNKYIFSPENYLIDGIFGMKISPPVINFKLFKTKFTLSPSVIQNLVILTSVIGSYFSFDLI